MTKIKGFFVELKKELKRIQWKEIPIATYTRWALAILLSVNTILTHFGINPIKISESAMYELVSVIFNVVILVINTYKNNSTSKEAILADQLITALKVASESNEGKAIDKVCEILNELNDQYGMDDYEEEPELPDVDENNEKEEEPESEVEEEVEEITEEDSVEEVIPEEDVESEEEMIEETEATEEISEEDNVEDIISEEESDEESETEIEVEVEETSEEDSVYEIVSEEETESEDKIVKDEALGETTVEL